MAQPIGFIYPDYPTHVCHLNKAIYGLKQVPRTWFSILSTKLLEFASHSLCLIPLYFCTHTLLSLLFLVYVDDIILTASNMDAITSVITSLNNCFPIKDLGPLRFFLGLEIQHLSQGLHLSQTKYIYDLLKRTNMDLAKPI